MSSSRSSSQRGRGKGKEISYEMPPPQPTPTQFNLNDYWDGHIEGVNPDIGPDSGFDPHHAQQYEEDQYDAADAGDDGDAGADTGAGGDVGGSQASRSSRQRKGKEKAPQPLKSDIFAVHFSKLPTDITNDIGMAMFAKAGELGVPVGFMCMKVLLFVP